MQYTYKCIDKIVSVNIHIILMVTFMETGRSFKGYSGCMFIHIYNIYLIKNTVHSQQLQKILLSFVTIFLCFYLHKTTRQIENIIKKGKENVQ